MGVPDSHEKALSFLGAEESEMSFHLALAKPLSNTLDSDLKRGLIVFASKDGDYRNLHNVNIKESSDGSKEITASLEEIEVQIVIPHKDSSAPPHINLNGRNDSHFLISYGSNYHRSKAGMSDSLEAGGIICDLTLGFSSKPGPRACVRSSMGFSAPRINALGFKRQLYARQRGFTGHLPILSPASLGDSMLSTPALRGRSVLQAKLDEFSDPIIDPSLPKEQLFTISKGDNLYFEGVQDSTPAIWGYNKGTEDHNLELFLKHFSETKIEDHFSVIDTNGVFMEVDSIDNGKVFFTRQGTPLNESVQDFFSRITSWYRQTDAPDIDTNTLMAAEFGTITSAKRLGGDNYNPVYLAKINWEEQELEFIVKPNSWNEYNDTRYEKRFTLLANQLGIDSAPMTGYRHEPFDLVLESGEKVRISSGASFQSFARDSEPLFVTPKDTRKYGNTVTADLKSGKLSPDELELALNDIHIMDILLGNPDRHGHNVLYKDAKLVAIDNAAIGHHGIGLKRGSLDEPGHGHLPVKKVKRQTLLRLQNLDRGYFKSWQEKALMNDGKLDWVMEQRTKLIEQICTDSTISVYDENLKIVPKPCV